MKLLKMIKMSILSITSISGVTFAINSCAINNSYQQDATEFKEFEKKAENESLENIVSDSNPGANGWDDIAASNLTQNLFKVDGHKISVLIGVISRKEAATFSITYTQYKPYNVYDWECEIQPSRPTDFNFFKMMAKVESLSNIVEYANNPAVVGWEGVQNSDLVKLSTTETKDSITINIKNSLKHQSALFTAFYIMKTSYQLVDWSCQQQPIALPNFDDFKKAAEAESAINVVKNASFPAQGWNKAIANNLKIETDTIIHKTLVVKIYDVVKAESATFSNTYKIDHKYNVDLWRCVLQPTQLPVFADFEKTAMLESLIHIVAQTKPNGWDKLSVNDLSAHGKSSTSNSVIINIISKSKQEIATFTATYRPFEAYKISDWKCSDLPKSLPNFDEFKKAAQAESAINILKNATIKANWNIKSATDFIILTSNIVNQNTVIKTIVWQSTKEVVIFSATYHEYQSYKVSDWQCISQPKLAPTWTDYWHNAYGELAWRIVKNAHPTKTAWINDDNSNFFFKGAKSNRNNTITLYIGNHSRHNAGAGFTAHYNLYHSYNVTDWKLLT